MEKEVTNETCANCKYFKRYYVIGYDSRFTPTNEGFCSNPKVRAKTTYTKKNLGCALWQPYELQKLKQQYCIEQALDKVNKTVEDILALLRDSE